MLVEQLMTVPDASYTARGNLDTSTPVPGQLATGHGWDDPESDQE